MVTEQGAEPPDLDFALLKAQVKRRLLGREERVDLDRFCLLRCCGRGGQGTVYEAFDPYCRGVIALKCLHERGARAEAAMQREFRALADLVHPNLVALHELFCNDERWFYTMELVHGRDFISHVRQQTVDGGEGTDVIRSALAQLLCGLYAIHDAGRLHRDLKPTNVLVKADGRVVILDYGLVVEQASVAGEAQRFEASRGVGTPGYMAPEQALGLSLSSATDLYAVGAILYEALSGTRLARRDTAQAEDIEPGAVSWTVQGCPDLHALCCDLLRTEPERRPTVQQALARIGFDHALGKVAPRRADPPEFYSRADPRTSPPTFIGRKAELAALSDELVQIRATGPSVVLVHGESGIGKSSLIEQFAEHARGAPDVLVLEGRCYEREHTPFKVFAGPVQGLIRHLRALPSALRPSLEREDIGALACIFPAFTQLAEGSSEALTPELRPANPAVLRRRAFEAFRELLQHTSQHNRLVLIIDDLQWGDLDSAALLQHVLVTSSAPPLLLVGAYRGSERTTSPFLRRLLTPERHKNVLPRLRQTSLGPLDAGEAAALLSQYRERDDQSAGSGRLGASSGMFESQLRVARGLPLALCELALGSASEHASQGLDLLALVHQRAHGCSQIAQRLLRVVCVVARPLEIELALRVIAAGGEGWVAAAELRALRLTRLRRTEAGLFLEPYHDLVRRAVVADMERADMRAVHAALTRSIEAVGNTRPRHLVEHWVGAGEPQRAGFVALEAAERTSQGLAPHETAELFRIAIALLPRAEVVQRSLHERLAAAQSFAGEHAASAISYERAAEFATSGRVKELTRLAAQQHMRAGNTAIATAIFKRLLAEAGFHYSDGWIALMGQLWFARVRHRLPPVRARVTTSVRDSESLERLETLGALYSEFWLGDPVRAILVHSWFFHEAKRVPDRYWLRALVWEIAHQGLRLGQKGVPIVARLLCRLDELVDTASPFERALAQAAHATVLLYCESKPRRALRLLREADRLLMQCGPSARFEHDWVIALRDFAYEESGRYPELIARVMARERLGYLHSERTDSPARLVALPLVLLMLDRPGDAQHVLRTRWQPRGGTRTLLDLALLMHSSLVYDYQGQTLDARRVLVADRGALLRSGLLYGRVPEAVFNYHLARAAVALYWQTRDARLRREVQALERASTHAPAGRRALFALLRASLARAEGDDPACRRALESARVDLESAQNRALQGCVRYRLAQLGQEPEELAAAHAWLRGRGVVDPDRWVALFVPGATGFCA
jgi:serine/threonine protein kinase